MNQIFYEIYKKLNFFVFDMNMLMMVLHDQKIMLENCILQNVYHEIALMVEIPFNLEQLL